MAAVIPLVMAGGLGVYTVQKAQANMTAKNVYKNNVKGYNAAPSNLPGDPDNARLAVPGKKKKNGKNKIDGSKWMDPNVPPTSADIPPSMMQDRHTLPLNTVDMINTRVQELNTRSKYVRKSVPAIPGITKDLPYSTFGLKNNPSTF